MLQKRYPFIFLILALFFFTACGEGGGTQPQKATDERFSQYLQDFGDGNDLSIYENSKGEELPPESLAGSFFKPTRGKAFILSGSLNLNLENLYQGLKNPTVRVKKIVDGKISQAKNDDFNWEINGQSMSIDMKSGLYRLTIKANQNEKKKFHRNIWLFKDENEAIQVSLPSVYDANKLLPGKWRDVYKSSYALSWIKSFPENSKGSSRDGSKGLIRLHGKKIIWAHPNGEISLGLVKNKKITWFKQPASKVYRNRRLPTALVFSGKYVYLGTYGNGLYVGRLGKERIKWLKHYTAVDSMSLYIADLALEGDVLTIGSFDEGLSIASVYETEVNVHNTYTKADFPAATTNSITTLELLEGTLLWNTYGDQLYSAQIVNNALSGMSMLDFPRDVIPGVTSRVVNTTPIAETVFVSTDTAALFSLQLQANEMQWEDFYAHYTLDDKLSDEPFTSLAVFNDELIIAGSADGLRLGIDGGYENRQVNWIKHHHVAKDKKLLGNKIYDLQLRYNMLFILSNGGLNTARLKYWTQWRQIS